MERGVYFDAWFPRQHCYHPSLPPRRLKMVDDLVDYRATMLVWSALGGGSLSLPYLEEEAWGEIDPRFRFYGFVNDSEFVAACRERGIKVFGIVFEVQGWEFPVELSEDESRVLALNELRGEGKRAWLGLREFSENRYPKLWRPLEHYFPGGLTNSDGARVTDLLEECCSRDVHGEPCHARWVECPDREHECYTMDRNNPVWREYLKAVIRIQVDAGVDGIQLDEAELPLTTLQYGGCFCKDCMKGFRQYLVAQSHKPPALAGVDLERFHYGEFLLERGWDFKERQDESPLFWDYVRFQRGAIARYFKELADYAREYAASQGRTVLVSGNFFNLFDQYYALEPSVDVVITEMRNTRYRQPEWYRYVAGFVREKPVVVVENPYGGVVPELVEALKAGRGRDRFRLSLYEAAALGANMSVPYGAWMGSVVEDSFWAPHELCVEIQAFLAEHEDLFSPRTYSEVAVVYSVESNFDRVARRDQFADNRANVSGDERVPFYEVCARLSAAAQAYDVLFFPDGTLRADDLTADDLAQYRTIVLPAVTHVTDRQRELLDGFEAGGGTLADEGFDEAADPQLRLETAADVAVNVQRTARGAAVHVVRYDFDEARDAVPALPELRLELRLPETFARATPFSPEGSLRASLASNGPAHALTLRDLGVYGVALLEA